MQRCTCWRDMRVQNGICVKLPDVQFVRTHIFEFVCLMERLCVVFQSICVPNVSLGVPSIYFVCVSICQR